MKTKSAKDCGSTIGQQLVFLMRNFLSFDFGHISILSLAIFLCNRYFILYF